MPIAECWIHDLLKVVIERHDSGYHVLARDFVDLSQWTVCVTDRPASALRAMAALLETPAEEIYKLENRPCSEIISLGRL